MNSPLPRYNPNTEPNRQAMVARAILESTHHQLEQPKPGALPGDTRHLRGIPAIGHGVTGAINNSTPGR